MIKALTLALCCLSPWLVNDFNNPPLSANMENRLRGSDVVVGERVFCVCCQEDQFTALNSRSVVVAPRPIFGEHYAYWHSPVRDRFFALGKCLALKDIYKDISGGTGTHVLNPKSETSAVWVGKRTMRLGGKLDPWPLFVADDFVRLKSGLGCLDRCSISPVSGLQREHQYNGRRDGKKCHDPLCERIARANERPDQIIPSSAYFAVLSALAFWAVAVYFIVRSIVEPDK